MPKLRRFLRWLAKISRLHGSKSSPKSLALRSQIDKLPVELVQEIFLCAAADPALKPLTLQLLRLSKWVNALLLPELYRSVYLHTDAQAQRFLQTITVRPALCRYIVVFDVPEVNIFKRSWPRQHVADLVLPYVAALDKQAPKLRTLTKIFAILFDETPAVSADTLPTDPHTATDSQSKGKGKATADEWALVETTPAARRLRSTTIHALTLSPPFEIDSPTTPSSSSNFETLRLPEDVTLSGFGTSSLVRWNFNSVQRLRFTSVVNGGTLRIEELLLLPSLTHLALPLWRSTLETTKALLGLERLKRLALFVLFDPITEVEMARVTTRRHASENNGDEIPSSPVAVAGRMIQCRCQHGGHGQPSGTANQSTADPSNADPQDTIENGDENDAATTQTPDASTSATHSNTPGPSVAATLSSPGANTSATNAASTSTSTIGANPNSSTASLQAVFNESEALRNIDDSRLILFNIREMVTMCRVPTQRFWDEVELRASHLAAHVVLGQLRSLAGRGITEL